MVPLDTGTPDTGREIHSEDADDGTRTLFTVLHETETETACDHVRLNLAKIFTNRREVHSLSAGKVEMYLCAAWHAFTPHVDARKNE